ncbi:MAG: 30S ribosomal protein THX [Ginsengibacter sp.]
MGRGDKKTKKGKIFKGSFGKSRPADANKTTAKPKEKVADKKPA